MSLFCLPWSQLIEKKVLFTCRAINLDIYIIVYKSGMPPTLGPRVRNFKFGGGERDREGSRLTRNTGEEEIVEFE